VGESWIRTLAEAFPAAKDWTMTVKANLTDIQKCLVFTDEMLQLMIERLDLVAGKAMLSIQVRMCNAKLQLHKDLIPTNLWTYDGSYPGMVFVVWEDQTMAAEWINQINGTLLFLVVESGK
jgi:hypothetical protein